MTLEVIGASHKTSPLSMRERLAIAPEALGDELRMLWASCRLGEVALLSTCNRVEYYFVESEASGRLGHHLATAAGLSREEVACNLYHYRGGDVARHLLRVAAGVDSMVVGETEILAQVKTAYDAALAAGTTGTILNGLFQRALAAAKRVHSATGISRGRTSVGSVAAALVRRELGGLSGRSVLVVGAGAMAENALSHIARMKPASIVVANRTAAHGRALASRFKGRAVGLSRLEDLLGSAHVVITSAGGAPFLLTREQVASACDGQECPFFILDLAVPRNVEPSAGELAGVRLFNVDDLKALCDAGRAAREKEVARAVPIIDEEAAAFDAWLAARQVAPVVKDLKARARSEADGELAAALKNLAAGASPDEELRRLARRLTGRFLHAPLAALKSAAGSAEGADALCEAAKRLHGIGEHAKAGKRRE